MIRIGIIGARGFAGGELLRLCLQHPVFRVTYVTSESQAGSAVSDGFPGLLGSTSLRFVSYAADEALESADAFFFALPDGEAMSHVETLLTAGRKIVDFSGDFRVRDRSTYEQWYRREHTSPHLLDRAVYGLPELFPAVRGASLVANPGCYPMAVLLAVAPLFARGLVVPNSLIVDAKSGVSGAGGRSSLDPSFSFAAITDNFRAYGVPGHRHTAEMEQVLSGLCGDRVTLTLTPHLLPLMRGILATCYLRLHDEVRDPELSRLYREFYADSPFVHILSENLPELRHVSGSNSCHLALRYDERTGTAICLSAIDNLVKGAAGSAIHNMNLICGLDETAGLMLAATGP